LTAGAALPSLMNKVMQNFYPPTAPASAETDLEKVS
jgi:hypothetical protein